MNWQRRSSDAQAVTQQHDSCAFYCDTCDRGFKIERDFNVHTGRHMKCTVEGCSYAANPRLIVQHYRLHHKTDRTKKFFFLITIYR